MIWIVFGSMLLALAAVLTFTPRYPACVAAYAAMWVARASSLVYFSAGTLLFWGVATLIVLALLFLLPPRSARSSAGVPFIAGGALVGMAVGMVFATMAGIIVATAAGAFFGALAYANTRTARAAVPFPSPAFFNLLGEKALPAVVTFSMVGAVLVQLLASLSI